MKLLSDTTENVMVCTNCDCVYQYENSDLLPILGTSYLSVICPKCHQQTVLVYDIKTKEADKVILTEGEEVNEDNDKDRKTEEEQNTDN